MDERKLAWVAACLLRGGVAPRHVRRCVEELRAHRADLIAQLRGQGHDAEAAHAEADARLGSPEEFCAATLARPELRGWAHRAPWLVFAILPLAAFVALGVMAILLVIACAEWGKPAAGLADPAVWRVGAAVLRGSLQWALPLAVGGMMLAVAWRGRTRPLWPAIGLLLLVSLATAVTLQLVAPHGGGKGELTVGLGFPPRDFARTLLLFGAAVGAVAAVWRRARIDAARDALGN